MEFIELIWSPYFWLCVLPFVSYVVLLIAVKQFGKPMFARGLPMARRFFPTRIRVWEVRANGYEPVDTRGRRVSKADGTEIFETLDYGDITPPKMISEFMTSTGGIICEFVMTEDNEFFPLIIKKKILEDLDKTQYAYQPITQEQKLFYKYQLEDSQIKYMKKLSIWDKIVPYIGIILLGLAIAIILMVSLDRLNVFMTHAEKIEQMYQAGQGIAPIVQNFTA